jgi:hypothetical protein
VTGPLLRVRLLAAAAIAVFLGAAFAIRLAVTGGGVLNSAPPLAQYSGTALYAAMVDAAVVMFLPRIGAWAAAAWAAGFCWLVEFFQLTGIPAHLADHSVLARLALGRAFDPADLLWYLIGILPVALAHRALTGGRVSRSSTSAWPP